MSFQTSALILSWIAILLLALVVSGLVRQVHALSNGAVGRPASVGLRPGSPAPRFRDLAPPAPNTLVLLFLVPSCTTCGQLLDEAAEQSQRTDAVLRVLYRQAVPPQAADLPMTVLGEQGDLFDRYDVIATPFAVVIDATGRIRRSEPVGSRAALRHLLDQADNSSGGGAGPTVHPSPQGGTL
ncbi:hypothetical protein GA0070624_4296 [Micromonospora rhizosphaerae]|uniref:Thioredoxin domain-containing protein n=1 Tax=Micromonospora rhizosphaerae TaxID=568872 RepID=A0A1C6SPU4_9ACTN|nr:hypothetical protein [Micromonospora rhizosphaerae]SCL31594.1 hypothetical protein GA0070624_4296 [Micromonospora rhizosphaerae]